MRQAKPRPADGPLRSLRAKGMTMRKILGGLAACALLGAMEAHAADLDIVRAPPVLPVPAFTWSGLYIGGNIGAAWGKFVHDDPFAVYAGAGIGPAANGLFGASTGTRSALIGGGQIGYNWQFNQFVFGLEGDVDGKSLKVTNAFAAAGAPFATLEGRARIEGSVRARAGLAFDRFLLYATGGWAVTDVRVTGCAAGLCASDDQTLNGYTVGIGGELALTNAVSVGVEYRFSDFGRESFNLGTVGGRAVVTNADLQEHQVTGRMNFRFGSLFQP